MAVTRDNTGGKTTSLYDSELQDILQLINLQENRTISTRTFSKDTLRTYLRSPGTDSNQKNLRALSDYLYNISHIYKRMINLKAQQITCKSWVAYPILQEMENLSKEEIMEEYYRVCRIVENMHMETQIYKLMNRAWRHDVVYGYLYGDPEQDGSFYIHLLNPDYCKIYSASYYGGVLGVAFDMSYFTANPNDLDYFDEEFRRLYDLSQRENQTWQELPLEKTICLKINIDNLDYPIVPLSGLLEDIINLEDLQAVQSAADELEAYKLIWAEIPTISGAKNPDEFAIDLKLANDFYKKLATLVPEGVNLGMSPMKLNVIDFKSNAAADDTTVVNKAYQQLVETNGSIVLNSTRITNSEAFKKAMLVESIDAMKPVEQVNAWINLYLRLNYNIEHWRVEFSDVSPYFITDNISYYKEAGQYGMPIKLMYASLVKLTPIKERGLMFLENQLGLGVTDWIRPLVSSNTQSAVDNTGGAPTKDETEISGDGVKSRDSA